MKKKQELLKQISFRLYANVRDRQIFNFLESLEKNQSEFIKEAVELRINQLKSGEKTLNKQVEINSPKNTVKKVVNTKKSNDQINNIKTAKTAKKRLLGGFNGFEG
ncbi:hypothetical protein IBB3154_0999 [Ligilactobacillus salivarius]|uniref:Uncharacterized protein n=1 Tax=Ligilactobacillus salivarius TaxID=1624 RepID=A0A1Y3S463_9LACO|nr:hypothetical protein [Ligilactobacillus salivarius]MBE5066312.1 hypothetical protein [Ligilactobacillus salivarius]MDM8284558.1 hypothetical protein [Ligilactobacillus salivarius]MSE08887.1 hypothetical protein [Ligilactobacillus salivarius]OUN19032.1 hypothetical protein B5G36_03340 [Ligilactobacillus salivarius]QIG36488.1 hypothetical protein IBB3154_0999 [Ligilactobacillus salivarius]